MKNIILLIFIWLTLSACTQPTIDTPILVPGEEVVLPTTCIDEAMTEPVITSISSRSGSIGATIEIEGCSFAGFEGDKQVWLENEQGIRGVIYGEPSSTSTGISFILKTPLCQNDNSYSGLECESSMDLIPGKYKVYVMPWGEVSNKIEFTISDSDITDVISLTYQDVIDYVDVHITDIMTPYSAIAAKNGKWFADGYGFVSPRYVYVDYEDGHSLYRTLLDCVSANNILSCTPLAVFENQEGWIIIQGEDTQKDNPITYRWAKDYEWKR